jgi:hypothetical protein
MALPQRERYEAARNLGPAGMPLKVEAHQAIDWEEFSSLRIQYEESLLFVAQRTFVSGDAILLATMEG